MHAACGVGMDMGRRASAGCTHQSGGCRGLRPQATAGQGRASRPLLQLRPRRMAIERPGPRRAAQPMRRAHQRSRAGGSPGYPSRRAQSRGPRASRLRGAGREEGRGRMCSGWPLRHAGHTHRTITATRHTRARRNSPELCEELACRSLLRPLLAAAQPPLPAARPALPCLAPPRPTRPLPGAHPSPGGAPPASPSPPPRPPQAPAACAPALWPWHTRGTRGPCRHSHQAAAAPRRGRARSHRRPWLPGFG
jgi:hypothetical protein